MTTLPFDYIERLITEHGLGRVGSAGHHCGALSEHQESFDFDL
jgi:hypothetical protein